MDKWTSSEKIEKSRRRSLWLILSIIHAPWKYIVKTTTVCSGCASTTHGLGQQTNKMLQPVTQNWKAYFKDTFALRNVWANWTSNKAKGTAYLAVVLSQCIPTYPPMNALNVFLHFCLTKDIEYIQISNNGLDGSYWNCDDQQQNEIWRYHSLATGWNCYSHITSPINSQLMHSHIWTRRYIWKVQWLPVLILEVY